MEFDCQLLTANCELTSSPRQLPEHILQALLFELQVEQGEFVVNGKLEEGLADILLPDVLDQELLVVDTLHFCHARDLPEQVLIRAFL